MVVDLQQMTCTCKKFDLEKLPCEHALRTAGEIVGNKFYDCCSRSTEWTIGGLLMKSPYISFRPNRIGKSQMRLVK